MCQEGWRWQRHRISKMTRYKGCLKISCFSCFRLEADKTKIVLKDSSNIKIYYSFLKKYHSHYILFKLNGADFPTQSKPNYFWRAVFYFCSSDLFENYILINLLFGEQFHLKFLFYLQCIMSETNSLFFPK